MHRPQLLSALEDQPDWDVLIIGGGATGLGAALESALRGYKTLAVEASDFAKGTSSRSTKLIHGGVRYLRSGQVRMVTASLRERGRLLRNAPHIAHPAQFIVPAYRTGERWYYYAGMKLYDYLAGKLGLTPAELLSRERVLGLLSTLKAEGLKGGVRYSDGQFDDARLALALAQSAIDCGAVVLNYARVVELSQHQGKLIGATIRDVEADRDFPVRAKVIVNATGVFAKEVMRLDSVTGGVQLPSIVPSRGTHLVLDQEFLPGHNALLIPETDDGRVLFAIPWQGRLLIGTTDQATDQIDWDPKPERAEIEYLLNHAARYLTRAPSLSDVRSVFAGLRPLVGKPDSQAATAGLSREHEICVSPSGLISVIGGKWTTYRQMGEDVIELAARQGNLPQSPSRTAEYRLFGANRSSGQVVDWSDPLAGYIPFQAELARIIDEATSLAEPIHPQLPFLKAHVVFAARYEMARTTDDFLARRTRALLIDAAAAKESAAAVAQLLGSELGWGSDRIARDQASFELLADGYLP